MARPFRAAFKVATLFACGILALISPSAYPQNEPANRVSAPPITFDQAMAPLYGPWKFQIGDSPLDPETNEPMWAESGFDDSQWETVSLKPQAGIADPFTLDPRYVQGWTTKGHQGYWGYAWYRIRLPVTFAPGERLAVLTYGWVDDGYQLFENGELLGSWGRFRGPEKPPVVYFTQPAMFVLPQSAASVNLSPNPVTQTLAFRVWMGPVKLSHHPFAGGLHYAPLLGEAGAIAAQAHLEWMELIRNHVSSPLAGSLFLLLAIVAATLILFDRSDPVYLWVAGALLLIGMNEVFFSVAVWMQSESFRTFFFQLQVIGFPLMFGAWGMVWWVWFKLRRPHWVPTAIAALTLLNMVSELLGEDLLYDMIPHPVGVIFHGASLAARLLLLAIIVFIVSKGIRELGWEGWLVLPAVVPLAFAQFQSELISLHWHGTFSAYGIVFFYSELANLLLSAVVALLLLRRLLLSVRRQRQMALDVKQAQEVQQLILPDAMTTLPGFSIESEYRPALEVGGDFFQILPHKSDGSLLIVAGDVTGKGLKAGMLVALLVGAIRTAAQFDPDPMTVLGALNLRLCRRGHANATCLALAIAQDGVVKLVNAGHIAPYLNGEQLAMEGALPLGIMEGTEFSVMHFHLKDGDKLVLMSDGIAEATDAEGALFGFERVHELLRTANSAAEVANAAQSFGQEDDISVISVTRTPAIEPVLA